MKKYYFFDLDGTLADTDGDIRLAWKDAMADMNLPVEDFDRLFVAGPTIEEMAKKIFPDRYSDAFAAELRKRFGEHYDNDGFPSTKEYPRIMERVCFLKDSGAKVFIVTNKRHAGTMAMAKRFGWDCVFDGIYSVDMYANDPSIGKLNKTAMLSRVIASLGAAKEESVMVGDTLGDFVAAAANGIESIAAGWGYGTDEERSRATRVASVPEDIA